MPIEREDSGGFFDSLFSFFYGPPPHKKKNKKEEKLQNLYPKNDESLASLPRATDDDLLSVLHVTDIDLNITENTVEHHTDKFACTQENQDDGEDPELVLRRGQEFQIAATFNRSYDIEKDDLLFKFKTGKLGNTRNETHGQFKINENGKPEICPDKWCGWLIKKDGNTLVLAIYIPANCAIGHWSITVCTKTKGIKKNFQYPHPQDIIILFNPWCKEDTTYIGDLENGTEEHVLNDHGCVFRGSCYCPRPKEWNFGQFEDGVLDAALFLILKGFKPRQIDRLSNPVLVARAIGQVVNCCDSDKGALWGRWDGNYKGGDSPLDWYGSARILKKYVETGKPVKYGQCWVFSGITTTVCRAVGLPARSVTNYGSAHDTDQSTTIDKYYTRSADGELVPARSSDSVWNFHVWNEVWMRRPDLEEDGKILLKNYRNEFDGWQAIDGTPQERSDGVFTCGPAPIFAIKSGFVTVPYDTEFIFSEVNADEAHWEELPDGSHRRFKLKTDKIGKYISTKKADGEPFDKNAFFSNPRCDVTHCYKYDEGTEEDRRAVMRANLGARNRKEVYGNLAEKQDIKFKLIHEADLPLGKDVGVKLKATNNSEYTRKITLVRIRFLPQSYTGGSSMRPFKIEEFKENIKLRPNQGHEFNVTLKHSDYLTNIDDGREMEIQAYAFVKEKRSRPAENCVKSHVVEFGGPTLEIEMPPVVKKGDEFEAVVFFNNPFQYELTECMAGYEGRGFKHVTNDPQSNVAAMGKFEGKFVLKARNKGIFTLTFKFTSKQLRFISGSAKLKVE